MAEENKQIQVTVKTEYLPDQSDVSNFKFIWRYAITITNQGQEIVQLLNRYWQITDLSGKVEEVKGIGVVGLQPLIKPQQQFSYTSFCQLETPQGTMSGYYEMQNLENNFYQVDIPKFTLSAPESITKIFRSRLH